MEIDLNQRTKNPASAHLSQYLQKHAKATPDKLALVDGDQEFSWNQLWSEVDSACAALSERLDSKQQQQIICTLMPNSWQNVVTTLAVWHLGHILFPIDIIYKTLEIDALTEQLSPELIVTDTANLPRITKSRFSIVDFKELKPQSGQSAQELWRQPAQQQLASLLFTSGTTGTPKVVPHTHQNHIWNIQVCSRVWRWSSDDSLLLSLRLSHWYGLVMGLFGAVYHGNTLFLQDRFDPQDTLKKLQDHKITIFTHGPVVYTRLLEAAGSAGHDLSATRLFISGSAPLPPAVWHDFKQRFGQEILEVYGTSETGRIASNTLDERTPGSAGRLLPGVQAKISDSGEVLVKSEGVFPGYYRNPKATAAHVTAEGWWRTGDLGELKDGRLFLKGRLQERIRKSGYSISPRDVEWALYKHKAIKEAHVTGVQQPSGEDRLIYWLVTDVDQKEIMAFCKANLPSVWRPDEIRILDQIPRNRSGKPQLASLQQTKTEAS